MSLSKMVLATAHAVSNQRRGNSMCISRPITRPIHFDENFARVILRSNSQCDAVFSITSPDLKGATLFHPIKTVLPPDVKKESQPLILFRGIPNKGNTCYLASVIQGWAVFQTAAFERKLANPSTTDSDKHIILSILKWIKKYDTTDQSKIDIQPILDLITQNPNFRIGRQEDASECIAWLQNFTEGSSPIVLHTTETLASDALLSGETLLPENRTCDPYPGRMVLELSTHATLPEMTWFDTAMTLLKLAKNFFHPKTEAQMPQVKSGPTLLEMIKNLYSPATVEEGTEVTRLVQSAEGSVTLRKLKLSSRQERLSAAPEELTLEIKRFRYDRKTHITHRLGDEISQVPETFQLPAECLNSDQKAFYKLRSVIHHLGDSPDSGHYVAYVRKIDPQTQQSYFIEANDSAITPIDQATMLKMAAQGYILIYDKLP